MNAQQIFNKVATHLLNQNEISRDENTCMYRGPNGLKCAVGALIADKHYDPAFERGSVDDIRVLRALERSGVEINDFTTRVLDRLQAVHDCYEPKAWPERLIKTGEYYNLDTSIIAFLQGSPK